MHLHRCGVEADGLNADTHDLLHLQLLENAVHDPVLRPAVHAGVDGVPVPESLGKSAPLAPVLGNIEYGIEKLEVR